MHVQDIVSYRSGLYFLPTGNAAPGPLAGSFVAFFRNGKAQGTAYRHAAACFLLKVESAMILHEACSMGLTGQNPLAYP